MMIRRTIAIFLLFFATIAMISMRVAPHHHNHDNMVCNSFYDCSSNHQSDDFGSHNDCEENESFSRIFFNLYNHDTGDNHGDDNNCGSCILKHAITLPTNQSNLKIKHTQSYYQHYSNSIILINNSFAELANCLPDCVEHELVLPHKINRNRGAKGLRAPPIQA